MMGAVCFVPVVFIVEFSAIFILHSSAARFLHYHHDTLVVELSGPPSQPPRSAPPHPLSGVQRVHTSL